LWNIRGNFIGRIPPATAWVTAFALLVTEVEASGGGAAGGSSAAGTLDLEYWVHFPNLPSIVVEWAALIPLTVYFSSFRNDYELAGEVSFRGR